MSTDLYREAVTRYQALKLKRRQEAMIEEQALAMVQGDVQVESEEAEEQSSASTEETTTTSSSSSSSTSEMDTAAAAAESGNGRTDGRQVDTSALKAEDEAEAKEIAGMLTQAAEEGNLKALTLLAYLYDTGDEGVVECDTVRSLDLYKAAAAMDDVVSQINVAEKYMCGVGVDVDLAAARQYWQLALSTVNAHMSLGGVTTDLVFQSDIIHTFTAFMTLRGYGNTQEKEAQGESSGNSSGESTSVAGGGGGGAVSQEQRDTAMLYLWEPASNGFPLALLCQGLLVEDGLMDGDNAESYYVQASAPEGIYQHFLFNDFVAWQIRRAEEEQDVDAMKLLAVCFRYGVLDVNPDEERANEMAAQAASLQTQ